MGGWLPPMLAKKYQQYIMQHNTHILVLSLYSLLFIPIVNAEELVTNVRVRQSGESIEVIYDLSKNAARVCLFMASGNSNQFEELTAVDGNVGKNVPAGKSMRIVWHPLKEQKEFVQQNVRFKVEALSRYTYYATPKKNGGKSNMETFLLGDFAYSFAPQMGYGVMFGQTYNGTGWYVQGRGNFSFITNTEGLTCEQGGWVDDEMPFYSGKTSTTEWIVTIGFVGDFIDWVGANKNRFNTFGFYVGGGYGKRELFWETMDSKWFRYNPTSYSGFAGDIGLIGSIYGLTFKVGVSTINFKYLELDFGIGWMF